MTVHAKIDGIIIIAQRNISNISNNQNNKLILTAKKYLVIFMGCLLYISSESLRESWPLFKSKCFKHNSFFYERIIYDTWKSIVIIKFYTVKYDFTTFWKNICPEHKTQFFLLMAIFAWKVSHHLSLRKIILSYSFSHNIMLNKNWNVKNITKLPHTCFSTTVSYSHN